MLDKFTLVFTNVPGPNTSQSFGGNKITNIAGCVNCPIGSALMLNSYNNEFNFSVCSDPKTISHPHEFVQFFEEEVDKFHEECKGKTVKVSNVNLRSSATLLIMLFLFFSLMFHFVRTYYDIMLQSNFV